MRYLTLFIFITLSIDSFASTKTISLVWYGDTGYDQGTCPASSGASKSCPAAKTGEIFYPPDFSKPNSFYINGAFCTKSGSFNCKYFVNPCAPDEIADIISTSQVECRPKTSSANNTQTSSASSSSACPIAGQHKDAYGTCTDCNTGLVKNILGGACETPVSCTYPSRVQTFDNTCHANPDNCALNASTSVLTPQVKCGQAFSKTECPSGWHFANIEQTICAKDAASSTAAGSAASTASTGAASSVGTNSSLSPLVTPTDNTSQTQSTTNSQSIPSNTTFANCTASAAVCQSFQRCIDTFGAGNCQGVTESNGKLCVDKYTVNGQILCVNSGASVSGSGTSGSGNGNSSKAGNCDPTASNYLACIGKDKKELPKHVETDSGAKSIDEVNQNFINRLNKSPVVKSFNNIKNVVSVSGAQCPEFRAPLFGRDISTTIHCTLWQLCAGVLSAVMIAAWSIIAFRIFASA
jgi:hypothetical protein